MKPLENLYYISIIESLLHALSKEVFVNNNDGLQRFCDININILNRHAPRKRKHGRGTQMPFITRDLSKAIIKWSRLRINFLKIRTGENKTLYTKQRKYCVSLLKKSKNKYFANLHEKISLITNFTGRQSLSDKIMTRDRINLSEKRESVKNELETAEVVNKFFSDIVTNLAILKYSKCESFIDNIDDQTLREILKYKNHPNIIDIQNKFIGGDVFLFRRTRKTGNSKRNPEIEQ